MTNHPRSPREFPECPHHYQPFDCKECDPSVGAAYLLAELVAAAEQQFSVRGHSPKCDGTCYCGRVDEAGEAYNRMSWAKKHAEDWLERFEKKQAANV